MTVFVTCKFDEDPIKKQGTNDQVTPKSIVRSSRNSNLSEILCLSRLSTSLIKIRLKLNRLCSRQGQIWCFLAGYAPDKVKYGVFRHSRGSNSEVKGPIWLEFKLVRDCMAVMVTCKFEDDSLKSGTLSSGQHFLHDNIFSIISIRKFFIAQGRVTSKWMVRSGPKSNLSKILWMSLLPASMRKIR